MKPNSANRDGFRKSISCLTRFDRFLVVLSSLVIVFACGRRQEEHREGSAAAGRTPTALMQEVVEPVGTLQKVINEEGTATTGVARGVRVIRDGNDLRPELGMELREGDRIVTDGKTRVVIDLEPGSEILLDAYNDVTLRKRWEVGKGFRLETEYVTAGVEMETAVTPR